MKNTKKIALCGTVAALITVICFGAYFPYLTYAIPALAGAFIIVPLFETDKKYAFFTYLASILPVALFCENESKLLYICFFGYYPILKAVYESFKSRISEYILKFLTFNAAVTIAYILLSKVLGFEELGFSEFGRYGILIFLVLGNIVFLLYDLCLTRLAVFYNLRLKKFFKRFL